jgi:hypothetical protein
LPNFVEFVERVIKDFDLIAHWHALQSKVSGFLRSGLLLRCWSWLWGHWPDSLSGPDSILHHPWRWLGCSCNGFFCLAFGDVVRDNG